jgi:type III pantothenate kinase
MLLLIDAGNSRTKWGCYEGEWLRTGACENNDVAKLVRDWSELPRPTRAMGCNVGGATLARQIEKAAAHWRVALEWIRARERECGVTNGYLEPETLGADRWAALIGARSLQPGPCLVVNAGTALTVDALARDGTFLGGLIVPGFDLMQEALARSTAQLRVAPGTIVSFPRTTADAMTSGALQALCGAVERMRSEMAQANETEAAVLLSGGRAKLIMNGLAVPARVIEHLVLEGLVRIALDSPAPVSVGKGPQ